MTQYILFIDDVGAEFTKARVTRRDVTAIYERKAIALGVLARVALVRDQLVWSAVGDGTQTIEEVAAVGLSVRLYFVRHGAGSSERRPGTSSHVSQATVTSDQVSVALVTGNGDDVVGDAADGSSRTAPGPIGLTRNWVRRLELTTAESTKIQRVDRAG